MGMRASAVSALAVKHEQDGDALETQVVQLLNVAVVSEPGSVVRCEMCGEQSDEHTTACPVPALEDWLQSRN
jgi:predicted metalloprotease